MAWEEKSNLDMHSSWRLCGQEGQEVRWKAVLDVCTHTNQTQVSICVCVCESVFVCVFILHTHLLLPTYMTDSRARGGAGGGSYHRDDAFG